MTGPQPDPGVTRVRRHLTVAGLVVVLLLSALATTVPRSDAALSAAVTNSTNTVGAATYFTCAAAVAGAGPGIYYKLNEAAGTTTATDSGPSARNGTYQGTVTRGVGTACTRDGGSAVTVNGSNGYVSFGSSLSIPVTYTGEAWFKTTSTAGGLLVGFGAAATGASGTVDRVIYLTSTGRVVLGINNTAIATITSTSAYNDGSWHHVMGTVGSAGMRLYLDGVQVASSTTQASAAYSGFLRVGYDSLTGWPSATTTGYNGSIDEVAVYGKTLTAADAASHYRAGI